MWKKLLAIFLLGSVCARVIVYYPTYAELNDWENVFIGEVGSGHNIKLIIDRGPKEDPWSSAEGNDVVDYIVYGNRMLVRIKASKEEGTRQTCITVRGRESESHFCPTYISTKRKINVAAEKYSETCSGEYSQHRVLVSNESIGETIVRVNDEKRRLQEGETAEFKVNFFHFLPGIKKNSIHVEDLLSGWEQTVEVETNVKKCVESEFVFIKYGIPVTNILLIPSYIIGGLGVRV